MEKIIIFYKYIHIEQPEEIKEWQHTLCTQLGLRGRVLLAHEGINATLGGSVTALNDYAEAMNSHPLFGGIDFKDSPGSARHFPRLRVVVKKEILNMGVSPDSIKAEDAAPAITPEEAHLLMNQKPEDLILIDTRNSYESAIGTFEGSIIPNTPHFRDFPSYIDQNTELLKDKRVLMFCTAGIRCERASAYVKSKNVAKEVLHIRGGIHRYIEQFPNGHFKGKNYVFDGRISLKVSDDILGSCHRCGTHYDEFTNCINAACNKQLISCQTCVEQYNNTCSNECRELVAQGAVNIRSIPVKISIDESLATKNV